MKTSLTAGALSLLAIPILAAVTALNLDHEVFAILEQAQGTAVFGDRSGVEQNKTFHGNLIEGGKNRRLRVA